MANFKGSETDQALGCLLYVIAGILLIVALKYLDKI